MSTKPYTVVRAICMDGQRVEPGATVMLTAQQAVEMRAAGKVLAADLAMALGAPADDAGRPADVAGVRQTRPRKPNHAPG
jgi:hypothetical protein